MNKHIEQLKVLENEPITGTRKSYMPIYRLLLNLESKEEVESLLLNYLPNEFSVATSCAILRGCGCVSHLLTNYKDTCIRVSKHFDSLGVETERLLMGIDYKA